MLNFSQVLKSTDDIRNVCFLAHVDHGKTTLSDSLISSVGIISERLSGKLRYLDNRNDEQQRMITIKSSSISLLYSGKSMSSRAHLDPSRQCLINLVDSPGHVDFAIEVATAARLCDGALLIVDVVEGICPQTRAVLRQAYHEGVETILVMNKMDRLILDLHLTPMEAYKRLRELVEQANALLYQLYLEDVCKYETDAELEVDADLNFDSEMDVDIDEDATTSRNANTPGDEKQGKLFYNPSLGGVIFTSAVHRWCVQIPDFAHQIASKLKIPENRIALLQQALWGNYYFDHKTKSIKPIKGNEKPLFVQFVLEQLWHVYDSVLISWDPEKVFKCSKYLNAKLPPRHAHLLNLNCTSAQEQDYNGNFNRDDQEDSCAPVTGNASETDNECGKVPSEEDRSEILLFIMSNWLPLAMGVVDVIIEKLPSPVASAKQRLKRICPAISKYNLYDKVTQCTSEPPTIVHVAKYLACNVRMMRLTGDVLHGEEQAGEFVAFSRIFNGSIRPGDSLYICESYNGGYASSGVDLEADYNHKSLVVEKVMILMGADLVDVDVAWPGNIVALLLSQPPSELEFGSSGLWNQGVHIHEHLKAVMAWLLCLRDPHNSKLQDMGDEYIANRRYRNRSMSSVSRHLTLASDPLFPCFPSLTCKYNNAIIRVSVEPQNVKDLQKLLLGLALLYISDPAVELDILKTGDYVLSCCGEVHLDRCLNDLGNLYAKIPINVSSPRVSIREGIINLSKEMQQVVYSGMLSNKIRFPPWKNTDFSSGVNITSAVGFQDATCNNRGNEMLPIPIPMEASDNRGYIEIPELKGVYQTMESKLKGTEYSVFSNGEGVVLVRALEMPTAVLTFLDSNSDEIHLLTSNQGYSNSKLTLSSIESSIREAWKSDYNKRHEANAADSDYATFASDSVNLWAVSVNRGARCLLYCNNTNNCLRILDKSVGQLLQPPNLQWMWNLSNFYTLGHVQQQPESHISSYSYHRRREEYQLIVSLYSGFDIACQYGPLADEPLRGVVFVIEGLFATSSTPSASPGFIPLQHEAVHATSNIKSAAQGCLSYSFESSTPKVRYRTAMVSPRATRGTLSDSGYFEVDAKKPKNVIQSSPKPSEAQTWQSSKRSICAGTASGRIISAMKNVCRAAYMQRGRPRIYQVLLRLELQCDQSVLGRVYSVLQKRRARIISENVRNGATLFVIEAYIPAADSFGLEQDLRSRASGGVSFHLQYSHWELVPEDPFPEVSMTDEDLEDDGFNLALMLQANVPRKLINHVRKLKGLATEHKVVEYAEKQRTLSTKK